MLLDKKLVLFHQDCENFEGAIKKLSELFMESGVAKETFFEGLMKREVNFPTGLREEGMDFGVAIPHTFAEHVNEKQIGFMSLNSPIKWNYMGDVSKQVDVNFVFMLALKEGHDQIDMLVSLMRLFSNNELMAKIYKVDNYEDLLAIMNEAGVNLE